VPFNVVVFVGLNVNLAEASTNGAKFQFDSFGELVCELRQIVSPAVLRDSFVVGFLLIFVCFVFEFVKSLRLGALLFSHKTTYPAVLREQRS
jgi:hypothetical protein